MSPRRLLPALLCLSAATLSGCRAPDVPEPSEFPYAFLLERVREAREAVDRARSEPGEERPAVTIGLAEARLELRRLEEYYLPVLEARHQVERAAHLTPADVASARAAVDSAEALLLAVVESHGRDLEAELREPLEGIEDARAALEVEDVDEAREVLGRLRTHLESLFFRGELVLEGSELDPRAEPNRP